MSISVLHVGAGRYSASDRTHPTLEIWRNLARGCRSYTVIGRSTDWHRHLFQDQNVTIALAPSWMPSEAEFLFTQLSALAVARRVRPDVVIAQCPALGGLAASVIKARSSARILMEFHGAHYFGGGALLSRDGFVQQLTRLSLPHATRIRALSEGMKREIGRRFGQAYLERTVVVPPRVDLTTFRYVKAHWRIGEKPRVVLVGSINENKGQLRFTQAILERRTNVAIWLVGDGPDAQRCQEVAQRYGRADDVRLFGRLSHEELAKLLPEADALVVYSRTEGTPRVILEGMAAGLPIVATNAGFIADILVPAGGGILLGDSPDDEIGTVLEALFENEEIRVQMGRTGRSRAEREFSAEVVYDRYRELVRETAES